MSGGLRMWRLPLLVVAALIVPAAILGLAFEDRVQSWVAAEWPVTTQFWVIVAALSGDILLPIPSSGVSTYAGGTLGVMWGTLASWLGMTAGAVAGYALSRLLGEPFARRFGGSDLERLQEFSERFGVAALILTRPLPLLAEACVLLVGTGRLPWWRFLSAVVVSNLVISLAYAAAGAYFHERAALPQAVIMATLVPMGIVLAVRRLWERRLAPESGSQRPEEVSTADKHEGADAHDPLQ